MPPLAFRNFENCRSQPDVAGRSRRIGEALLGDRRFFQSAISLCSGRVGAGWPIRETPASAKIQPTLLSATCP